MLRIAYKFMQLLKWPTYQPTNPRTYLPTRDVRGGEFSLGAGRGGARKKIFGAGRGGAGRGKKARKLTDLQNSTKTRKWKICVWIAFLAPKPAHSVNHFNCAIFNFYEKV